jgi:hypothetical protein
MSEAWYKEYCPNCEAINWICNGDESDLTGMDVDGYKCRKCGVIHYLGPDYEFDAEMGQWENVEDCNWELGKEIPD